MVEQRSRADIDAALARMAAESQRDQAFANLQTQANKLLPTVVSRDAGSSKLAPRQCNDTAVADLLDPPSDREEGPSEQIARQQAAIQHCGVCAVRIACLDSTLQEENQQPAVGQLIPMYDVRGGLTRRQRDTLVRRNSASQNRRRLA